MKSIIALIWFHNFLRSAAHFAPWGGRSASPSADDVDGVVESEDVDDVVETEDIDDVDGIVEPEGVDGIVLFWSWDGRLWYSSLNVFITSLCSDFPKWESEKKSWKERGRYLTPTWSFYNCRLDIRSRHYEISLYL